MKPKAISLYSKYQVLLANIFSLSLIQASNYILPLLVYPFVIRKIGDENFGSVMFCYFIVQFFMIFIDFGYNYTGTRNISKQRSEQQVIVEIFYTIIYSKLFLLIISSLLLIVSIYLFPKLYLLKEILFIYFLALVGNTIFPIWYYQGIEKMKYLTYLKFTGTLLFLAMTFFFIKGSENYLLFPLFHSISFLVPGIIGLIHSVNHIKKIYFPSFKEIIASLNASKDTFVGNLSSSLYLTAPPIILGFMTETSSVVGFYTIAEKSIRGIRYVLSPISQAMFPNLSVKLNQISAVKQKQLILKITFFLTLFSLFLLLLVIAFRNQITLFFMGAMNERVSLNILVLSPVLVLGTINNILGTLWLINVDKDKVFRNYVLVVGLISVALCCILSYLYLDVGAAVCVLISELILSVLLIRKFLNS